MMATHTFGQRAHSALVEMDLILADRVLPIAQMGPEFLMLATPSDHPPCDAEYSLRVDGQDYRGKIRLPDGLSSDQRTTRLIART